MTPFDSVADQIKRRGFYNQRLGEHTENLRRWLVKDLGGCCAQFKADLSEGVIACQKNMRDPASHYRKLDFVIGDANQGGDLDLRKLRICLKSKSVMTAHGSRNSRFWDLYSTLCVLEDLKSDAVLVATVIVGVAERVLNVPDRVKPRYKKNPRAFECDVLPRLSSGDQSLWEEFDWAISPNRPDDPQRTIQKFRELPIRRPGRTHVVGYDYVLLVPAHIDNVNPPFIVPANDPKSFGIDVERDYATMLDIMCKAYTARWHL